MIDSQLSIFSETATSKPSLIQSVQEADTGREGDLMECVHQWTARRQNDASCFESNDFGLKGAAIGPTDGDVYTPRSSWMHSLILCINEAYAETISLRGPDRYSIHRSVQFHSSRVSYTGQ